MPPSRNSASWTDRQGILGTGSFKLNANWVLLGAARYDLNAGKFDQTRIGLGYVDDCLILALNYITSYTYSGNPDINHAIMLQLSLRTLGGTVGEPVGRRAGRALMLKQSAAARPTASQSLMQWTPQCRETL